MDLGAELGDVHALAIPGVSALANRAYRRIVRAGVPVEHEIDDRTTPSETSKRFMLTSLPVWEGATIHNSLIWSGSS